MKAGWLQSNSVKTEVLWCALMRQHHKIPTGPVRITDTAVMPVGEIKLC